MGKHGDKWLRVTGRNTDMLDPESVAVFAAVMREMMGGTVTLSDAEVVESIAELCRAGFLEMEVKLGDEGIEVRYELLPPAGSA